MQWIGQRGWVAELFLEALLGKWESDFLGSWGGAMHACNAYACARRMGS